MVVMSPQRKQSALSASSLQAWSFLSHLPVLEVSLSVKGWWEESQEQSERPLPAAGANLLEESSWLDVHADQEYVLQVSLRRITTGQQKVSAAFFVPCHRYVASSMLAGYRSEIHPKGLGKMKVTTTKEKYFS